MNATDTTTAPGRPALAWPLENTLVSAALAAQRISWIDAPARALGLKPFTRQQLTRQALAQVRRSTSGRPARVRTAFGSFLMPLSVDDACALIAQAEEAGARGTVASLTPEGRRTTLTAHAASARPLSALRTRVRSAAAEEAAELLAVRQADDTLPRAEWCAVTRRLARRIVLGDGGADDTLVSDILEATLGSANSAEHSERAAALRRRIDPYVPAGTSAEAEDVEAAALEHALEVVTRALDETVPQALALVTVQPLMPATDRAELGVAEALRRYPPLAATVHEITAPFAWRGTAVEAGTEILCATAWLRDLDEGEEGTPGPEDPSVSLCAAPAPCAAAELAVLAATELVRALTRHAEPVVRTPRLDPAALPATLPAASLGLALVQTGPVPVADTDTAERETFDASAGPAAGQSPAHYAALASASARRLEEHARRLAECARQPGWNRDAFGEQCRMRLLAHAERCARAATDARRAAEWLLN
ncbi:hypothetical protein [Streptomyces sp. NBC_01465]|uniref:hypothetical protein n=1 Tax=Streptomyces sp. NBC_01465 TaxID=2903878 RepID=UPI002E35E5E1|nr:hypothetical protein [Streptomyces sp. NBC_01465]